MRVEARNEVAPDPIPIAFARICTVRKRSVQIPRVDDDSGGRRGSVELPAEPARSTRPPEMLRYLTLPGGTKSVPVSSAHGASPKIGSGASCRTLVALI